MKIGIIGPSKLSYLEDISKKARDIIKGLAKQVAESNDEIVGVPDKGSVSEFFMQEYTNNNGKRISEIISLDDKEFGYKWVNLDLGKHINCGTWRNQPEKLNEETDVLLCLGYSTGGLIEIAYSKWFKPKMVYIIKELIDGKLPPSSVRDLNLKYISHKDFLKELNTNEF